MTDLNISQKWLPAVRIASSMAVREVADAQTAKTSFSTPYRCVHGKKVKTDWTPKELQSKTTVSRMFVEYFRIAVTQQAHRHSLVWKQLFIRPTTTMQSLKSMLSGLSANSHGRDEKHTVPPRQNCLLATLIVQDRKSLEAVCLTTRTRHGTVNGICCSSAMLRT